MSNRFNEDYYLRGKELGISGYENYRWLPDLTLPMADRIAKHLGVQPTDSILDFGCARGYLVRALCERGYDAWGVDTSEWAVANCDPSVQARVALSLARQFDWIIAKDVLEHIPHVDLTVNDLMWRAKKGIFVVVPLSGYYTGPYVIPDYEGDVTHVQRHPLVDWFGKFMRHGWSVEAAYRVPGIKDNWYAKPEWRLGNGFLTARRVAE